MGRKLELTGKRFGRLTVVKEVGKNSGHITWLCRCDCGKEIVTTGIHLKSGHTRSCNCAQKETVGDLNKVDITGKRFGRLIAIKRIDDYGGKWFCRCDCGNHKIVSTHSLRSGATKSCGCISRELTIKRNYKNGMFTRHEGDITFSTWMSMWYRCLKPGQKHYHDKGISVCDRWRSYDAFLEDMGPRPSLKMTIDRIDYNGNYEPGNCRWATQKQQMQNMSRNVIYEYRGEKKTIAELADIAGVKYDTMYCRLKRQGLTPEQAVNLPVVRWGSEERYQEALRALE